MTEVIEFDALRAKLVVQNIARALEQFERASEGTQMPVHMEAMKKILAYIGHLEMLTFEESNELELRRQVKRLQRKVDILEDMNNSLEDEIDDLTNELNAVDPPAIG